MPQVDKLLSEELVRYQHATMRRQLLQQNDLIAYNAAWDAHPKRPVSVKVQTPASASNAPAGIHMHMR